MQSSTKPKDTTVLTLSISTIHKNLNGILAYLKTLPEIKNTEILIICQTFDSQLPPLLSEKIIYNNEILIYYYNEKGISNSRNRAIEKSLSAYIWFLDDDITFNLNEVNELICYLSHSENDCEIVKIGSLENDNEFYKNYSSRKYGLCYAAIKLLQVSSIEIIVKKQSVKNKKISFNPHFGLGSKYPAGEENLFLIDLFKQKSHINFLNITPIKHTTLTTYRLKKCKEHYIAQGYIATKFPFYIRIPLILRWSFRRDQEIPLIKRIKYIISGNSIMDS